MSVSQLSVAALPAPKLLVIDDDPVCAALVEQVAIECGFAVTMTEAAPALFRAVFEPETVIVLDIVLPDEDGLQVMRRLAAEGCRNPIIVLSGYEGEYLQAASMLARALGLRVAGTVEKPFEFDSFRRALTALNPRTTASAA